MNNFLLSTASQQEIQSLDNKIHETVETINSLKTSREFFLSFAKDPQLFINKWLQSQSRDLKTMTDVTGNPEEERRVDFYYQPWVTESVCRFDQFKIPDYDLIQFAFHQVFLRKNPTEESGVGRESWCEKRLSLDASASKLDSVDVVMSTFKQNVHHKIFCCTGPTNVYI